MINVPWATDISESNLILVDKHFILSDYEESEADIVYRAEMDGKDVIFYTLLEFQSTVDYRMPLRLLFYINEILRDHTKNLVKNGRVNKKSFDVPAIVPIVLYNSIRKWNAPRYFKDIIKNGELFGDYIVNFRYILFDVNHEYTKEELIRNNNITSAIFLLDQKVEPLEFIDRLKIVALEFNKLTDSQKMILKKWIRNTVDETIVEDSIKILDLNKEEEVKNMVANNAFIIKEMKEKVRKEGMEEGKADLLMKVLIAKFKSIPENYENKIKELPDKVIDEIVVNIFDMNSIEDLIKYF